MKDVLDDNSQKRFLKVVLFFGRIKVVLFMSLRIKV